jgi:hypothetical protein
MPLGYLVLSCEILRRLARGNYIPEKQLGTT